MHSSARRRRWGLAIFHDFDLTTVGMLHIASSSRRLQGFHQGGAANAGGEASSPSLILRLSTDPPLGGCAHHHSGACYCMDSDTMAEEAAKNVVQRLKATGINMLALDFDLTVLDIHTGGRWSGTPYELSMHVRPFFRYIVPLAAAAGVHPAVVTFSPQTAMIREVLKTRFGELGEEIPIRGEDGSWRYDGRGDHQGKQGHMASAVEELQRRFPEDPITRRTTVLVDDDRNNIEVALRAGVKAVWLDPRRPDAVVDGLLQV